MWCTSLIMLITISFVIFFRLNTFRTFWPSLPKYTPGLIYENPLPSFSVAKN